MAVEQELSGSVYTQLMIQFNNEWQYQIGMLIRIIAVITFLAFRVLLSRNAKQITDSLNNRTY